jgi:hypothetical protein
MQYRELCIPFYVARLTDYSPSSPPAPSLQFSIVPDNLIEGQHIWRPPYRDAADVIIEKILDRKTIEPIEGYTYEQLKQLNLEQKMLFETSEVSEEREE